jgi:hypothetical protein
MTMSTTFLLSVAGKVQLSVYKNETRTGNRCCWSSPPARRAGAWKGRKARQDEDGHAGASQKVLKGLIAGPVAFYIQAVEKLVSSNGPLKGIGMETSRVVFFTVQRLYNTYFYCTLAKFIWSHANNFWAFNTD